jgi:chemotaxis protein MotA
MSITQSKNKEEFVMNDTVTDLRPDPIITVEKPHKELDIPTTFGLISSLALIGFAVWMGQSQANFFNLPSVFIVILGTLAVTAISYTSEELSRAGGSIRSTIIRDVRSLSSLARTLLDLSVLSKKKGLLAVSQNESELSKNPFLHQAMQLAADGFPAHDIEQILQQDIEALVERQKKAASMLRRASEIAPGMGLIGTLVGLVQMLAQLDNPASIGPAMAIALLTTFYGAIMGTVVLAPLAAKIERNIAEDTTHLNLIMAAAACIARQENPRRLEIILNSILPPLHRIRYFD